jgi:molecular chaperone GrpE
VNPEYNEKEHREDKDKQLENEEIKDKEASKIDELEKELEEAKNKAESNLAGWQRAQADFVNFRRAAEQEKQEICKYASRDIIKNLLPVIDDFERVIDNIPEEDASKGWVEGLKLVDKKFRDTLAKQGVTSFNCLGKEFDPQCMDALSCGKGAKDMVIMEIEKGYKMNDKVIRPAKVVVGDGESDGEKEE